MPLIREDDLVRIDLPAAGEWVEVKRVMSRGDEIAVQRALTAGGTVGIGDTGAGAAEIPADVLLDAAEFATLERAIRKWSFPERVTPATIRQLDGASVDCLKSALNELYAGPRSDDDRGNSSEPIPLTSRDGEDYQRSSVG